MPPHFHKCVWYQVALTHAPFVCRLFRTETAYFVGFSRVYRSSDEYRLAGLWDSFRRHGDFVRDGRRPDGPFLCDNPATIYRRILSLGVLSRPLNVLIPKMNFRKHLIRKRAFCDC